MTVKTCPHCSAPAKASHTAQDYNKRLTDESFHYFTCTRCALVFMDPVPGDLGRYYPTDYYEVPRTEAELAETATRLQQWKLDTVLAQAKTGRLLEIGPAYGLFAYLAKRAGFDVTGIEMDARCCAFLRETVGITVVESNDPAAAIAELPGFDVIVMWQVIEHFPDPWRVLDAAAARLNPGGVIILDTPNPAAFQFGVLGHRWAHLDAPRHVLLIPVDVMVTHMARNGLDPLLLTAADYSANGFNGFGWAFTFKNFLGENVIGRAAHLAGRVLAKLLIPIERTGWRGSTYTAVFGKPVQP